MGPTVFHVSEYQVNTGVTEGMTVRQALQQLRAADFGDIGTATVTLDDDTEIWAELVSYDNGNSYLMRSQRLMRRDRAGRRVRDYRW